MSELVSQLVTSIANDRRSDEKKDKKTLPALTNLHIQRASADTRLYIGADQGSRESEMLYIFKSKKKKKDFFSTQYEDTQNEIPTLSDVRLCVKEC